MNQCLYNLRDFSPLPGNLDPIAYSGSAAMIDDIPEVVPLLPIKNTVLFPYIVMPITVYSDRSSRLVMEGAKSKHSYVCVTSKRNLDKEELSLEDIYRVGTIGKILRQHLLPDGHRAVLVQGVQRTYVEEIQTVDPYHTVKVRPIPNLEPDTRDPKIKGLLDKIKHLAKELAKQSPETSDENRAAIDNISHIDFLTYLLSNNIQGGVKEKQRILEAGHFEERAKLLTKNMKKDYHFNQIRHEIFSKTSSDIDQQQRDYFLRQQIKVLQNELGDDSGSAYADGLAKKASEKLWPQAIQEKFDKELAKLSRVSAQSPEYPILSNYLETLTDLPWGHCTVDNFNLRRAKRVLDRAHYGLDEVKDRILEYLAIRNLNRDAKGPILCFAGPPGVGKTSLGKSIAEALERKYVRMSLGGITDEAEIRGHRKTYIGAMCGKIVQNILRAKSSNPVFILDEIDKVGHDFRGDPSSALLEVLDPEQNSNFKDNYLEVDYDLSQVMFVATANSSDTINAALRDRMEIIYVSGYTTQEKQEIATRHLVKKQLKENGMSDRGIRFTPSALRAIISNYTRESGVRNMERKIASILRNLARAISLDEEFPSTITPSHVREILGPEKFKLDQYEGNSQAGVATGLAWTPVGGDILYIESKLIPGRGKLIISGQLGKVMQESVMAAFTYLKSQASALSIPKRIFENYDLHVHVPEGAIPKDGPSAGTTILTSLASAFTQRRIMNQLAMTGEITLRGKILPVGGIKEKILAAKRSGIHHILLSEMNRKDVEKINQQYLKGLSFHYVQHVDEMLGIALTETMVSNPMSFDHTPLSAPSSSS